MAREKKVAQAEFEKLAKEVETLRFLYEELKGKINDINTELHPVYFGQRSEEE
jgi:hypothetical protein